MTHTRSAICLMAFVAVVAILSLDLREENHDGSIVPVQAQSAPDRAGKIFFDQTLWYVKYVDNHPYGLAFACDRDFQVHQGSSIALEIDAGTTCRGMFDPRKQLPLRHGCEPPPEMPATVTEMARYRMILDDYYYLQHLGLFDSSWQDYH